jgi:succinoglycan biosynthesis transport protein ExoP
VAQQMEQEQSLDIGQYVQILRHRKWWLIAGLMIGWSVVTAVIWVIPAKYQSQALVLVEHQQVSDKLVTPNVDISLQQRLDAMTQRVLSRSQLTTLIDRYNLYPKQRNGSIDDAVDDMRKDIDIQVVAPDKRKPDQLTGFTVAFSALTPIIAQRVTADLVSLFISENARISTENSTEATTFFDTQLQQAAKDLAQQEQKLREFKAHNLGALPEQLQSNLQILSGLQTRLQTANDALSRAQQQQTYLQSLLSQYHPETDTAETTGSAPPSIDNQITSMRAQLAALKAKYTEKHPDVLRLEEDLAALEALRKKMQSDPQTAGNNADAGKTSLGQIRSQLKANEMEITARKKDIRDNEAQIASYQARLNQTPVHEQELATLIRDHDQSLSNYNSLLARKQQTELAGSLVARAQGERFTLLDPASLPEHAAFPNRLKFSLGAIAAGLALGIALMLWREFSRQTVYTNEQVHAIVHAPVLTTIPNLYTAAEQNQQKRRGWLQAIAASLLIAMIPAGTLVAFLKG